MIKEEDVVFWLHWMPEIMHHTLLLIRLTVDCPWLMSLLVVLLCNTVNSSSILELCSVLENSRVVVRDSDNCGSGGGGSIKIRIVSKTFHSVTLNRNRY